MKKKERGQRSWIRPCGLHCGWIGLMTMYHCRCCHVAPTTERKFL